MRIWHNSARERAALLRLLVKCFEGTSRKARDPKSHASLLAAFRQQLAEVEMAEAARLRRYAPLYRLAGLVFGVLRVRRPALRA